MEMEYSREDLRQLKLDYQNHGPYELKVQVPHLIRLAEFYEKKYKISRQWTDCVRAHGLYNAISARKPEDEELKEKIYSIQRAYWGDNSSCDFDQQQLTARLLKNHLEAIRKECRDKIENVNALAYKYDSDDQGADNSEDFFSSVKDISMNCSARMTKFARQIIHESVAILKPPKPPCEFVAVAIGSLARGEATPYSDLEYFFLIKEKSVETVEYFERLAITSYFLIGNLGETKLAYMAIKELEGWFDDKSKSGFKIDGLSEKAGNIPTGNGSPDQHNHFIATPQELAERYQNVLDDPQDDAIRGDLTALLTYMTPIFSYRADNLELLMDLKSLIQNCGIKQFRQEINLKMLNTDVRKFNFTPSKELQDNGFSADVKREIYRFPSILLLDICIVKGTATNNSWESLQTLVDTKLISANLHSALKFLLAAAAYMRLSTYLHHDSQDDRMSVSQEVTQSQQTPHLSKSPHTCRWFVPGRLFTVMCGKLITLKQNLAKAENIAEEVETLQTDDNNIWSRITTLHYMGRHSEAFVELKQVCGENLCDDPVSAIRSILSGQSEYEMCYIASEALFWCHEYRSALKLCKHITNNNSHSDRGRMAACYKSLGYYKKAVTLLQRIQNKSAVELHTLGLVYIARKEYEKAEHSLLQALGIFHAETSPEILYDYYGDRIETEEPTGVQKIDFMAITSPEDRLCSVSNSSHYVIVCITSLGNIYNLQGQFILANYYYKKTLQLISEEYGEGAAVHDAAITLYNQADNYQTMGQFDVAKDCYKKALSIYRKISQGDARSSIAFLLFDLGNIYGYKGHYIKAVDCYNQALIMFRKLSRGADSSSVLALTMLHLGTNYNKMGRYGEARDYYEQALASFRKTSQGVDNIAIAGTLYKLGCNYNDEGEYDMAEDYHTQALDIERRFPHQSADRHNYIIVGNRWYSIELGCATCDLMSSDSD